MSLQITFSYCRFNSQHCWHIFKYFKYFTIPVVNTMCCLMSLKAFSFIISSTSASDGDFCNSFSLLTRRGWMFLVCDSILFEQLLQTLPCVCAWTESNANLQSLVPLIISEESIISDESTNQSLYPMYWWHLYSIFCITPS